MFECRVPVDNLRVGVFIRLDLKWFEHPFLFNRFKIKTPDQIRILKSLGLSEVYYQPGRSDCHPGPSPAPRTPPDPVSPPPCSPDRLWEEKMERIRRLRERNGRIQQCRKRYDQTFSRAGRVMKALLAGSHDGVEQACRMIHEMVERLLGETEVAVHLVNTRTNEEGVVYHTLNVAILGLLLGRERGLGVQPLEDLGMGALLHDLGKDRIPKGLLLKKPPLTRPERRLLQLHPVYGEEMASRIPGLSRECLDAIRQHHEAPDGTGYPDGLPEDRISPLAKILSIANAYENLCNPREFEDALSPHEALSLMFGERFQRFDPDLISLFIRSMGVYPPGTVVELSNGVLGMVVSVHPDRQLQPCLLLYDPDIPPREALLWDMQEDPEITIEKSIRPSQLPREVGSYLNPSARLSYSLELSRGSASPRS